MSVDKFARERTGAGARALAMLAVGFGCMVGYTRMLSLGFVGYFSEGVFESTDACYVLRSALCVATLVLLAVAGWKRAFALDAKALMVATAAAVAAPIVYAVDPEGAARWIVAVLGGVSSAVIMYVWMLVLSCYRVRAIVCAAAGGLIVSGALIAGASLLDAALALVIAAFSAFASGALALLLDVGLTSCAPDGPLGREQAARVPWMTVSMVLASGFLSTAMYGIAEHLTWLYQWEPNDVAFAAATVVVLVATFVLMLRRDDWMWTVWAPVFTVLVVALVFACFSLRASIQIAVGLMLAAVFCSRFLYWAIFPAIFKEQGVPRAFLAGVFLVLANGSVASALGDAVGGMLPHSMQNLGGVAGIVAILLGGISAATYFACRRAFGPVVARANVLPESAAEPAPGAVGTNPLAEDGDAADAPEQPAGQAGRAEPAEPEQSPLDSLQSRIDGIAEGFDLTPREVEVGFLTAQGFSAKYIAERLVVSESTVRFHQRNLYRKLDVHSRNEFIEFANRP